MPFKITITETRRVKKAVGKEWAVIGTKESKRDAEYRTKEAPTRIEDVYGYTPEIEKTVDETRTVLEQSVDELSLKSVIKAINAI